jgi:type I restriction enzyme, S subunit
MMATMNDNGENERSLPVGWEWLTLSEVADLVGGGTPSRKNPEYFTGDIIWLTPTEIPKKRISVVSTSREKITLDALKQSSAKIIPKGSVLMTSRASIGYVAIAGTEVTTNQGFASFIPKQRINNLYLAYWLWANADFFIEQATGTTFKEITKSKLRNFSLPVPTLPEQEKIVNRIEELLSDLDAGVSALERVRTGLKQYQKSMLNAAITGKLVKQIDSEGNATELLENILEHRKTIPARNEIPLSPDFSNVFSIPSLPNSWTWATLDQLTWSVRDGMHFSPEYVSEGVPFITGGNVRPTGVDFEKARRISHELHNKLIRFKPDKGDILYTKGGTTGIARVNTYDIEFNVWVHVAVLKLFKNIDPFYIQHALNSPFCYQQSQKYTHGVGNQDLGLTRMIKILIPLPPLDEQRRIVAEVERRLSVVGEVESAVEVGRVRAGRLRQSVLRSAFEGRL